MTIVYILGGLLGLLLATGLTPLVKKFAIKVGAVDVPNARKVHTRIMPRMGGLAIYGAFLLTLIGMMLIIPDTLFGTTRDANLVKSLLVGGSVIVLIGALDDRFELSAKVKLLGQIVAASVVVFYLT